MTDQSDAPLVAKLHATDDALVWAEEFCRLFPTIIRGEGHLEDALVADPEGLMVTWFANAMEVAKSLDRQREKAYRESEDYMPGSVTVVETKMSNDDDD